MTRRLAGAVLIGVLALTGCATSTEAPDPGLPPVPADSPEVSDEAAAHLCDMIAPELDNWRTQGTAVARVSFNGTVHNWAARSGGINAAVTRNRAVIDTVTSQHCPEVREQAIQILEVPDLASALAGF
ncbi:hypothetical protein [Nocardia mangyaensis]|uniref:hypothetical protein n=1 Tax=Nocardia mangyaensis TaxID=2213200 RepID=UPI00267507C8|nr:hypothetical protein [Nocardia mangyaensis]MDO3646334.1 hypothetical protein [Nocardia mangyaensis]